MPCAPKSSGCERRMPESTSLPAAAWVMKSALPPPKSTSMPELTVEPRNMRRASLSACSSGALSLGWTLGLANAEATYDVHGRPRSWVQYLSNDEVYSEA